MSDTSGFSEYAQFRKTFFEECAEMLADMEGRLIAMQADEADDDQLNAIFRAVHSIKAGAGAFQFVQLVRFAHTFEAVLDRLRDGRLAQSARLATTLIHAGDILAAMVDAAQSDRPVVDDFGADVAEDLSQFIPDGPATGTAGAMPAETDHAAPALPAGSRRFTVSFKPHAELFRHANEPLLLIRELQRLGETSVTCHSDALPGLADMDSDDAYLAWTITLTTSHSKADVIEVFEFVDQDCDLTVTEHTATAVSGANPQASNTIVSPETTAAAPARTAASRFEPADGAPRGPSREASQGRSKAAPVGSIRVDLPRIDRLVNMVGELVITQAMLAQQISELALDNHPTMTGIEDLSVLTRELQECVMAIRMQPVKSVFARMPRLVREVAAKVGKDVRLVTSGEQTEVDKTVIEELADPLTHMIRNSIDHGIESPEARRAAGKPAEGTIQLSAAHVGSNIVIHVSDDGAGLDPDRIRAKAIEKGIIPADAQLSDDEINDLIFAPGFSTAVAVTELSGRGVGMDVVRRNITALGGRVQVSSVPGKGSRFTLVIPLTLAVLDGMIVAVGTEKYILPLTSIVESYRPEASTVRTIPGGAEVASVRGDYVRLIHLHRIFGVENAVTDPSKGLLVLVETARGDKVAIVVDELIGQQQVVIKSLLDNSDPVDGISGATILGNGRVALILDIEQLAAMTVRRRVHGDTAAPDHRILAA